MLVDIGLQLRLVTYNIRYAAGRDNRERHEEPWAVRCPKLATQLRFVTAGHGSAFICLQEALHHQLRDVHAALGGPDRWAYIGEGRDGGQAGEWSPVFYRPGVWACEESRTFWLSKTPAVPSLGWDAALNRIVTVGVFVHRATGRRVVIMGTHFDHRGVKAREESAKLILRFVRAYSRGASATLDLGEDGKKGHYDQDLDRDQDQDQNQDQFSHGPATPVLLGGDFNSSPGEAAYKTMTAQHSGMVDVHGLVPPEGRYGNDLTYTSFGEAPAARIDFLFVSRECNAEVETYGVLSNRFEDGVYISDHRPVVADMAI